MNTIIEAHDELGESTLEHILIFADCLDIDAKYLTDEGNFNGDDGAIANLEDHIAYYYDPSKVSDKRTMEWEKFHSPVVNAFEYYIDTDDYSHDAVIFEDENGHQSAIQERYARAINITFETNIVDNPEQARMAHKSGWPVFVDDPGDTDDFIAVAPLANLLTPIEENY